MLEVSKIYRLHDQDFFHIGKKLINPLNSTIWNLQLRTNVCYLDHFGHVYQKNSLDQHGLHKDDVQRFDKQNWASVQCICAKKARTCLHDLQMVVTFIRKEHWGLNFIWQSMLIT